MKCFWCKKTMEKIELQDGVNWRCPKCDVVIFTPKKMAETEEEDS